MYSIVLVFVSSLWMFEKTQDIGCLKLEYFAWGNCRKAAIDACTWKELACAKNSIISGDVCLPILVPDDTSCLSLLHAETCFQRQQQFIAGWTPWFELQVSRVGSKADKAGWAKQRILKARDSWDRVWSGRNISIASTLSNLSYLSTELLICLTPCASVP